VSRAEYLDALADSVATGRLGMRGTMLRT
jgi:hypothetical protein